MGAGSLVAYYNERRLSWPSTIYEPEPAVGGYMEFQGHSAVQKGRELSEYIVIFIVERTRPPMSSGYGRVPYAIS